MNQPIADTRQLPREYQQVFADAERTTAFAGLWQQMQHSYLNLSLPPDLRELILATLSHQGRSRFCRALHGMNVLQGVATAGEDRCQFLAWSTAQLLQTLRQCDAANDPAIRAEALRLLETAAEERTIDASPLSLADAVRDALLSVVVWLSSDASVCDAADRDRVNAVLKQLLGESGFVELQLLVGWFATEEHWARLSGDDPQSLNVLDSDCTDERFLRWVATGQIADSDSTATAADCRSAANNPAQDDGYSVNKDCAADTAAIGSRPVAEPAAQRAAAADAIQAALIESEARYRRFVDQTLDGTYRLDFDPPIEVDQPEDVVIQQMYDRGRIGDCNAAYARMYGCEDPEDLVGVTLCELHGGDDVPENLAAMQKYVREGFQHLNVRTMEVGRDGKHVHLINNSMGIVQDGRYECCWGTQTDITELVEAQESARQHHELSEMAMNTSPNIVALLDSDGRIRRANPCLLKLAGWDADEVVGQDWLSTFFAEEDRPQVQALFSAAPSAEAIPGFLTRLQTRAGSLRDVEWRCATMTDQAGQVIGLLCTGQDVTERQAMERHVLQASTEEQRRIAQDLHDGVGQQLTGLTMMADVLKRMAHQSPAETEAATLAEISSEIAVGLNDALSQVRQLARGLYPVVIDPDGLSSALKELCRNSSRLYGLPVRLTQAVSAEFNDSQTPTQLYRIAQEAISNAVRHGEPDEIQIALDCSDDRLRLTIVNDGRRFPDAAQRQAGLGLRSMNYRARMIGATLEIRALASGGTEILCQTGVSAGFNSED